MSEQTVSKKKISEVNGRLLAIGVSEADLQEDFIKGSGKGGQKINKTNSCVQLTFLKTGLVVRCQKTRSREDNRFFARRILLERLEQAMLGKKSDENRQRHKIRTQKKRRSRKAKAKMLEQKKHRADIKQLRKKPADCD
ncbi:MAG: peptide chain release factor-like protein [Deltaproteobacteria bacterium]|nr:peptide chain release factor-like protein [Deltaproteobacteria bacterium]